MKVKELIKDRLMLNEIKLREADIHYQYIKNKKADSWWIDRFNPTSTKYLNVIIGQKWYFISLDYPSHFSQYSLEQGLIAVLDSNTNIMLASDFSDEFKKLLVVKRLIR